MKNVILVLLLSCVNCYAGNETGTVRFSQGQHGSSDTTAGRTFFFLDGGARTNAPPCATFAEGERWVINNDWPAAKLQNSILLSAAIAGKKVIVRGSGNCNVWRDTETAIDISITE